MTVMILFQIRLNLIEVLGRCFQLLNRKSLTIPSHSIEEKKFLVMLVMHIPINVMYFRSEYSLSMHPSKHFLLNHKESKRLCFTFSICCEHADQVTLKCIVVYILAFD